MLFAHIWHAVKWYEIYIFEKIERKLLDITFDVLVSQLSGHCDVNSNLLWRHQQNVNRVRAAEGRYVKIAVYIVIYGIGMSYEKWNYVCTPVTN